MNTMMKNFMKPGVFGLALVVLLGSGLALAHEHDDCDGPGGRGHPKMGHHGMSGMKMYMAEELGLTDSQKAQIKAIMKSAREENKGVWKEMKQSRKAIREAIHKGASDEELRRLAMDEADIRTDMLVSRAQIHRNIQAVLTDEQRAKAEQLRQAHEKKWQQRWEKRREQEKSPE